MPDNLGLFFVFGGILSVLFGLAIFAVALAGIIFWILMIIDAVKRKFPKEEDKIVWVLVVVLMGIIGALIYYLMIKKKDKG